MDNQKEMEKELEKELRKMLIEDEKAGGEPATKKFVIQNIVTEEGRLRKCRETSEMALLIGIANVIWLIVLTITVII